jgi:hypothetical protein
MAVGFRRRGPETTRLLIGICAAEKITHGTFLELERVDPIIVGSTQSGRVVNRRKLKGVLMGGGAGVHIPKVSDTQESELMMSL